MGRTLTHRQRMDRAVTEAQLQRTICETLTTFGWKWHHETDSRLSPKGLPDLICVHPRTGRLLFIECKRELGRVTVEQTGWLNALTLAATKIAGAAPGPMPIEAFIARPSNLDQVLEIIEAGAR